jgi:DNA polymerase-3 subunit alpha
MQDFVHLHVHSEYSILDGAIGLSDLIARVKALEMGAVALTDHGNLFGAVEFYRSAVRAGIKPVLGMEAYITTGDMKERERSERIHHLTLLARDREGFRNLIDITSQAHIDGFYRKPRVDKAFLSGHAKGLIALSGCAKGEVPSLLMAGDYDRAEASAAWFRDMFGPRNFFVEIQDVGLPDNEDLLHRLRGLAERMDLPMVATNDVHYLSREDALSHEVLLCIQTGKKLHEEDRMRLPSQEFYLRTPQEMFSLFADVPDALKNTLRIAEMTDLKLDVDGDRLHLPRFDIPSEYTSAHEYLSHLAHRGLEERMGEIPQAYRERLRSELEIIEQTGYSCYFLIIWDIVKHAREMGVSVGPGRGSAVSSIVLYGLGVTRIDPLEYGLLFERFLNPERVSPPDVDLDFGDLDREKVIRYVKDRFGEENVCQIVTFGRMMARAVIRDVGRVMDIPYGEVDRIAKMVPRVIDIRIDRALSESGELRTLIESKDEYKRMIETARKLEGRVRNVSTHAAGVVIAPGNIRDFAPIYSAASDEGLSTQFEMGSLETLGLLKVDLLGLRTLTILEDSERMARLTDPEFRLKDVSMEDPEVFELLSRGDTLGVFQLESRGMRDLLKGLRPTSFREVIAVVALYRPGPLKGGMVDAFVARKHGREEVRYLLPQMEEILEETYGVIVYQEQVMKIAAQVAGFTMGQADLLRRAMGKKKASIMAEQVDRFVTGAQNRNVDRKVAKHLFKDEIVPFAGYGFPKSHATGYGLISYWTAYMKAHYPREFMCANMSAEMAAQNFSEKVGAFVKAARKMGITVTPPDVNRSAYRFTLGEDGEIVYGFGAVKNVGEGAAEDIVNARGDKPFKSLSGFLRGVRSKKLNKKAVESLIKAGAFDSIDKNRSKLLSELKSLSSRSSLEQAAQSTLFKTESTGAELEPIVWDLDTRLSYEKTALGFFLSGHPLSKNEELLESLRYTPSSALEAQKDKASVSVVGTLIKLERRRNRNGQLYAQLVFEDFDGEYQGLLFPNRFEEMASVLRKDESYFLQGRLSQEEERGSKVLIERVIPLEEAPSLLGRWLVLRLDPERIETDRAQAVHRLLLEHDGQVPVYVKMGKTLYRSESLRVSLSKDLLRRLSSELGRGNAVLVT